MKILPFQTLPPPRKVERRHTPPEASGPQGYREYRACLRWEFGFTCAFCLLHEGDLTDLGAKGMGVTWIEHFQPTSLAPDRINEYENCFYTCLFCNRSRAAAPPEDVEGRKLINPVSHVWAEHFFPSSDGRLLPAEADPDAAYTAETYDLDDPRKVRARRLRRERLSETLALLRDGPHRVAALLARSEQAISAEESRELVEAAETLRDWILRASSELGRYALIPFDADGTCRCGRTDHHTPPAWLADQGLEIA